MYYVYILTNKTHSALYIGVTNDIERRMNEHSDGKINGFTKKYNIKKLIYCEEYDNPNDAIAREKQLKGWRRSKKEDLINSQNPNWLDYLSES